MALITDKFVYVHLPKTGGQFVRHVISGLDIACHEHGDYHADPPVIADKYAHLPFVTTIRHPVTWYQSRWHHRMRLGWVPEHPVDWECASNDFNEFVLNIIDYDERGRFTALVKLFGRTHDEDSTTHILKNESLSDDMLRLLRDLNYDVDTTVYNNFQRVNVSGNAKMSSSIVAAYRPEVLDRLLYHERWVIDRFYDGVVNPNCIK